MSQIKYSYNFIYYYYFEKKKNLQKKKKYEILTYFQFSR